MILLVVASCKNKREHVQVTRLGQPLQDFDSTASTRHISANWYQYSLLASSYLPESKGVGLDGQS